MRERERVRERGREREREREKGGGRESVRERESEPEAMMRVDQFIRGVDRLRDWTHDRIVRGGEFSNTH